MHRVLSSAALAAALTVAVVTESLAQEIAVPNRKELKRVDLTGAPGMEVVTSMSEYKPGDVIALHIHHGIETGHVVSGGMVQPLAGGDPIPYPTGLSFVNLRDVPHGGIRVVGDKTVVLYTVHIVDKGKALYDTPSK